MKKTLLFALALIAAAPVDGVAQVSDQSNQELVNLLYEGRSCKRMDGIPEVRGHL